MSDPFGALDGLGIDAWQRPGWIGAALLLIGAALVLAIRSRPPALAWPSGDALRAAGARRHDALRLGAIALRGAALVCLALVIAGPVGVHRAPPEPGLGLDIVLALDASGSMRALDTEASGSWRTRLSLAREVVRRFAERRVSAGDRVGLVVFGESVFTACPLTSDGALLAAALARVEPGVAGEATALGDALALSVKRARAAQAAGGPSEGRVVVLLTDGRHNAGALSVEAATALAVGEGVRVHTVAIGSSGEEVPMDTAGSARRGLRFERHDVDVESLRAVAAASGGRFHLARRGDDLAAVYAEIDGLERVPRPLPPQVRTSERPEPLLAAAAGFLLVELAAARVLRRRLW